VHSKYSYVEYLLVTFATTDVTGRLGVLSDRHVISKMLYNNECSVYSLIKTCTDCVCHAMDCVIRLPVSLVEFSAGEFQRQRAHVGRQPRLTAYHHNAAD